MDLVNMDTCESGIEVSIVDPVPGYVPTHAVMHNVMHAVMHAVMGCSD